MFLITMMCSAFRPKQLAMCSIALLPETKYLHLVLFKNGQLATLARVARVPCHQNKLIFFVKLIGQDKSHVRQ